ncbi:MAG: hypothetical protein Q9N32_04520 [Gammaproteobacteria bacterium]|nr:hypothetical protein [Gammaproteobacteria bacterium]
MRHFPIILYGSSFWAGLIGLVCKIKVLEIWLYFRGRS